MPIWQGVFLMSTTTFAMLVVRDMLPMQERFGPASVHLKNAVEWLCRAQDQGTDHGVSYGYSARGGWKPSYRETSGYIATTFFNLSSQPQYAELGDRAIRIVDWLCDVQNNDGSFSNHAYKPDQGIVFDTGQDLFGLVRGYNETGHERFLDAAKRAGQWLTDIADSNNCWTRSTYLDIPHVYNARSAWALLQLNKICPNDKQEQVARSNLDWAVSQEHQGYFEHCAFESGKAPYTHTIAYTIRGLLESSIITNEQRYADCAERAARAMIGHLQPNGFMAGQVDCQGHDRASYCCLTGNAQLAIIWARLFHISGDNVYKEAAVRALRFVMFQQNIATSNLDIRGAIKGSYPIWGRYSPLTYPNWATKFYVDALLLCQEWLDE